MTNSDLTLGKWSKVEYLSHRMSLTAEKLEKQQLGQQKQKQWLVDLSETIGSVFIYTDNNFTDGNNRL